MQAKKYGLQIRAPPSRQHTKLPTRPQLTKPLGFDDDDDDDVESEISRQANKNKSLRDIEEQHKKALEEDPSVFDYDGVYDVMKDKVSRPRMQDRQERKPKYIQALVAKAKQREREHEVIYDRKLAKERSKDDHLYADKDKFVTSAYKKKLAEQAKWMEEERLRDLREEREDVTKKSDISDFYFNLSKNVAFGSEDAKLQMGQKQGEKRVPPREARERSPKVSPVCSPSRLEERNQGVASTLLPDDNRSYEPVEGPSAMSIPSGVETGKSVDQKISNEPKSDHHKRSEDAVTAAKERFMARKRAKQQY
ncbi:hypothetical protein Dimus_020030 [Dionaea muscipula]